MTLARDPVTLARDPVTLASKAANEADGQQQGPGRQRHIRLAAGTTPN